MLSPVSPPSKSSNPLVVLGNPNTITFKKVSLYNSYNNIRANLHDPELGKDFYVLIKS